MKEEKNKGGRPPKFTTKEEMQVLIDKYLSEECADKQLTDSNGTPIYNKKGDPVMIPSPPTISGLALYLGFTNRCSVYEYMEKGEFTDTIKRAVAAIEDYAEKQLFVGNSTGAIFWLKNRGWVDKQVNEHQGAIDIKNFLDSVDEGE